MKPRTGRIQSLYASPNGTKAPFVISNPSATLRVNSVRIQVAVVLRCNGDKGGKATKVLQYSSLAYPPDSSLRSEFVV
jgi:hypothetical protein